MTDTGDIELRHLPERVLRGDSDPEPGVGRATSLPFDFLPGVDTLDTLEHKMIRHALDQAKGVKAEAARLRAKAARSPGMARSSARSLQAASAPA